MNRLPALIVVLLLSAAGPAAEGQDDPQRCPTRQLYGRGLEQLAEQLHARERALDRRARSMGDRQDDLREAETRLTARIDELNALLDTFEERLGEAETLDEERLSQLARMTGRMREKQAAAMLLEVEPALAARVLDRMNPTKAGRTLAAMPPRPASQLAERLSRPLADAETVQ